MATTRIGAVREIESIADPTWESWLRIYHGSFPETERMSEGYFHGILSQKAVGEQQDAHILKMLSQGRADDVLAIAYYTYERQANAGFLWYLASREDQRGQGLGARFYEEIVRRLQRSGATSMLFEVEIPSPEAADAAWAARRIAWYRRQGARLLSGIRYFQTVDVPGPPVPMHIMVHPFGQMTAEEAFEAAKGIFEEALEQTGPLSLT